MTESASPSLNRPMSDAFTSIGLLILRLGMGGYMLTHGIGKLQMLLEGKFDQFSDPIGWGSTMSLIMIVVAEFGCAILVMVGFATRLAAVTLVIAMGVAAFKVHGGDPWTMGAAAKLFSAGEAESWASKEPALLFLFPFLALVFTGAGKASVDALIGARLRRA